MIATQIGETAIALSVINSDTAECVRAIRNMYGFLRQQSLNVTIVPGLDSLLIEFEPDFNPEDLLPLLESLEERPDPTHENSENRISVETVEVPICYEDQFAPDLAEVSTALNLTKETVIELHVSKTYEVWMLGFMPGFPYLGPLDPKLRMPRKSRPQLSVPKGSVAIAEEYTGIYPFDSPGGWYVIGRTPLSLVDYTKSEPCLFHYAAKVKFYSISADEFSQLSWNR